MPIDLDVPVTPPRVRHLGNGLIRQFAFGFPIYAPTDLEVFLDDQRLGEGFLVQPDPEGAGGVVLFEVAPSAETVVTLQRRLPLQRISDFQPSQVLRAEVLNEELDRIVAMVQQIDRDVARSLHLQISDDDVDLALPEREARASRLLGFDAAGNAVALSPSEIPTTPPLDLDAIPEGEVHKHFTVALREKLEGMPDAAASNPPPLAEAEKIAGTGTEVRSFSPRDIADMVGLHGSASSVGSVFGRKGAVVAAAGDYHAGQIADAPDKVIMTAAERRKLAAYVSVTDFGALGDGTTDDSAAFTQAAAQASARRRALHVPAGTYRLTRRISFSNTPVALIGDGIGLSVLLWTAEATDVGISITSNSDKQFHMIRDLSLLIARRGGAAITLDYTGQVDAASFAGKKLTMDRSSPRFLVENCFISGSADPWSTGWDTGVDAIAALKGNIVKCSFTGWLQSAATETPGSPFAFRFRGIDGTYENGHPCEFLVEFSSVYYAVNAITFDGCEGGFVGSCNLVGCTYGVVWQDGFGRPQLNVSNCHMNIYFCGILTNNCAEFTAQGNLIYAALDLAQAAIGICLAGTQATFSNGSSYFCILGNTFMNTSTKQGFNGIIVSRGTFGLIDCNVFQAATTGIWLTAGAANCRVGASNIFAPAPAVANRVLNQGTGNTIAS